MFTMGRHGPAERKNPLFDDRKVDSFMIMKKNASPFVSKYFIIVAFGNFYHLVMEEKTEEIKGKKCKDW